MGKIKGMIKKIPGVKPLYFALHDKKKKFEKGGGSKGYWETRYASGGNSGDGSYGRLALFKAEVLNNLIDELGVSSVIELGCGDGNQTSLLDNKVNYLGLDISPTIIERNIEMFHSDPKKGFLVFDSTRFQNIGSFLNADMTISLDVLYHLIEVEIYQSYLKTLFDMANQYVVIYASDNADIKIEAPHVFIRSFTPYIAENFKEFQLIRKIENKYHSGDPTKGGTDEWSWSDFFLYRRTVPKSLN